MGRIAVVLDPAGYKYASEPGVSYQITGAQLAERLYSTPDYGVTVPGFWQPPGSDWLLVRPLQFDPDWPRDGLTFSQHLLNRDQWAFAGELTVKEWAPLRLADGTEFPQNKWISAYVPETVTSLDSTSYTALGTAAGIQLPLGMKTVAVASEAPNGTVLSEQYDHAPWFSWVQPPGPNDYLVFGWADFALVCVGRTVTLCRTPTNDQQTWEKLGSWVQGAQSSRFIPPNTETFLHALFNIQETRAETLAVSAIPVGWEHLYLTFGKGAPQAVRLREATEETRFNRLTKAGAWWIGASPGQTLNFQCQIIGYPGMAGEITQPDLPLFDLGDTCSPTVAPELDVEFRMDVASEADISETDASGVDNTITCGDPESTAYPSPPAQQITYTLTDENGDPWVSDGTHHKARFWLRLGPTNAGSAFLAPQFRRLVLRFPEVLTERTSNPLTLYDTQWYRCGVETSLYEPEGKRVYVDLWDAGAERLSATNRDLLDWYPIHIVEDTNGDGTYDTVRAAGWIDQPELTLQHEAHPVTGKPVAFYRLRGRGLLTRGDQDFEYLPELVDPTGEGHVEHKYAVKTVLRACGLDTDSSTYYQAAEDPYAGTARSRLPGSWKAESGVLAHRTDSPLAPSWDEPRLAYCERIATEFAGWRLYETAGRQVQYHPDLQTELQLGRSYHVTATLYATQTAAAAAGVPLQYYQPEPIRGNQPPEANVVRVVGKDGAGSLLPQVLIRDEASISTSSDEDFIGERRTVKLAPRMAVNREVMQAIAKLALLRLGRRSVTWAVNVPKLAFWQFSPAIDVGHVLTLQGRGDWLLIHMESDIYLSRAGIGTLGSTRLTLERLPAAATASGSAGGYPGAGG